jgi:predicted DNA-binding transcriptional regulator AlpA
LENSAMPFLSTKECAAYYGWSESWLNKRRVYGGGPPFIKIGGNRSRMIRYNQRVVDEWLEAQTQRSTSETPAKPAPSAPEVKLLARRKGRAPKPRPAAPTAP